jgi:flagellin
MGFRIKTNVETLTAQRFLNNNISDLNHSLNKLSSGSRITKSADDAAGLAISESLKAKIRGLAQAKRNASDGVSFTQITEGALSEISNMLVRLRELNVQAASDTVGLQERTYLDKEYQQLVEEIDRTTKSTEFNGQRVLSEDASTALTIQVGYNNTPEDRLTLVLSDAPDGIDSSTLGLAGTGIALENREEIADNIDVLDHAFQMIANSRATLGATESRLEKAVNSIMIRSENMSAANSRIRDVDYAYQTGEMAQEKILTQAGISALTQANSTPEMALQLLKYN